MLSLQNISSICLMPFFVSFRVRYLILNPVKIIRNPLPLTLAEARHLKDTIDVLSVSESHGIDIYASVLQYVSTVV